MHVIAVANQKGGVGKTTTVINLAAGLAKEGVRVLVVDMDFQANATDGLAAGRGDTHMAHVLVRKASLEQIIVESTSPGVWLAPAGEELVKADLSLANVIARETVLRTALERDAKGFDVVLVDTSPYLGLLTVNGLVAADSVLVPVSAEYYPMLGLRLLNETIEEISTSMRRELKVLGYLVTSYDRRLALSDEVLSQLRAKFGAKVLKTLIRTNANLKSAPAHRQDIFQFEAGARNPRKGVEDYTALASEVLKRLALKPSKRRS